MINRRRFLRGMMAGGLTTVHLPIFEMFLQRKAYASTDGFPTRFGLFYWGNGMRPDQWVPTGTGSNDEWELSSALSPLQGLKDKVAVVSGMSLKTTNYSPHSSGLVGFLTGQNIFGDDDSWTVPSPTIDQFPVPELGL